VRNLVTCAHDTGNYLLNIGPQPEGSVPDASVRILTFIENDNLAAASSIATVLLVVSLLVIVLLDIVQRLAVRRG